MERGVCAYIPPDGQTESSKGIGPDSFDWLIWGINKQRGVKDHYSDDKKRAPELIPEQASSNPENVNRVVC